MVYRVSAAGLWAGNGVRYTPQSLCQALGGTTPPAQCAFPILATPGAEQKLGTSATAGLRATAGPWVIRADGLTSCASVIFVNSAGDAFVYHANTGTVKQSDVQAAASYLGAASSLWVAYAHRGGTDKGYQDMVAAIAGSGVPDSNIVEITNLRHAQFGINQLGELGY